MYAELGNYPNVFGEWLPSWTSPKFLLNIPMPHLVTVIYQKKKKKEKCQGRVCSKEGKAK